jgi:type II secretory pathway pseudopilin PulG
MVELLIVIVVVATLAGLGTPMILRARTKALRSQSANHLRQLHMACISYSYDNQMLLPNSFVQANADLNREQSSWRDQLVQGGYLGDAGARGNFSVNYKVLGSPIQWREAKDVTTGRNPPVYPTYGMNAVLSMIVGEQRRGPKQMALSNPSRTLLLSEGYRAPESQWFGVSVSPWGAIPNNHDGIVTFAYADGRVDQMPIEEFPTQIGERLSRSWFFWNGMD